VKDHLLCIGGPLDGKRMKFPNAATKLETALDAEGTYTCLRIRQKVKDYMNEPHPISYLQIASVLVWQWDGSFENLPDVRFTAHRLDSSDWTRVEGTETRIPSLEEEDVER
jgi:hypothetical protein